MRAAIYTRISTEDQSDYSLDKQERDCRAEIERRGWTVYDVYTDEGISAKDTKRPSLLRLRADIQTRKVQAVVVHKTDRLMRNLRLLLEFIEVAHTHHAAFVSVTEKIDFSTPLGWAMFQVQGVFSEMFINNLRMETKKGLTEKAQQGHWVGGTAPYGYRKVDKRVIVPANDATTDAVRLIYALYSTGRHGYAAITQIMNERYPARIWSTEGVQGVLQNKAYCGYVSSGVYYKGNHEAIVTEEQWNACAALRLARTRKIYDSDNPRPQGTQRGILLDVGCCAACNRKLWQRICGSTSARNVYYMCSGNNKQRCDIRMSRMDRTDAAALEMIRGFALAVEIKQDMLSAAHIVAEEVAPPRPVVDRDALYSRLDRLSTAWVNGNLSDTAYQQQTTAIKKQLEEVSATPVVQPFNMAAAVAALESLSALIDHASIEERRDLINLLFRSVWVQEGTIRAVHTKPLYGVLWRETRRLFSSGVPKSVSAPQRSTLRAWQSIPIWTKHQAAA